MRKPSIALVHSDIGKLFSIKIDFRILVIIFDTEYLRKPSK